jgi:hypothetical protein
MSVRQVWLDRSAFPRVTWTIAGAGALLVLVAVLGAVILGRNAAGPSIGSDQGAVPPAAASAPPSPPNAGSRSVAAPPTPSPSPAAACAVTRPQPVFKPPKPFPVRPPDYYESDWYGSSHLWTMLDRDGEVWGPWLFAAPPGLPQKTFWWSADWHPDETGEWEPPITVTGRRLDGPETFKFGPGTNASADFGTAMLVGIDIPSYGCWELTARYRKATLSYVVSVVNP